MLYAGGNYNRNLNHGMFYHNANYSASNSNSNIGSRIQQNSNSTYSAQRQPHPLRKDFAIGTGLSTAQMCRWKCLEATMKVFIMKRTNNLFNALISDDNIQRAIDAVNKSHRYNKKHQPNQCTWWVESTRPTRVEELRQVILSGFTPAPTRNRTEYDVNAKKERNIREPRQYPDQYIHHILIQAIQPVMMRGMDYWCCGSIKGLGSQVSQLLALAYLTDLDHKIKEKLYIKHYIRYMDDFVLIHESKEHLQHCLGFIRQWAEQAELTLNKKTALFPLSQGISFLQWHFHLTDTGKVIMKVGKNKIHKEKRKFKKLASIDKATAKQSLESWKANVNRGNAQKLIPEINKYFKQNIMEEKLC